MSRYLSAVLILFKYFDTPPTFSEMDILLSFKIIIKFFFKREALFNASYAIPPVSEPSPITETIVCSSSRKSRAFTSPKPADMEVELCPVSKQSHSLSFLFGKPLIPPYFLKCSNPERLPVSNLCV